MSKDLDKINKLIYRYKEIVESDRNKKNKEYWANSSSWDRDMWRGIPKKNFKNPPLTVGRSKGTVLLFPLLLPKV